MEYQYIDYTNKHRVMHLRTREGTRFVRVAVNLCRASRGGEVNDVAPLTTRRVDVNQVAPDILYLDLSYRGITELLLF